MKKLNLIILLFFVLALAVLGTVLYTNASTLDTIAVVVLTLVGHLVGDQPTLFGHLVGDQPTPVGHPLGDQPPLFGHFVGN